MKVADNVLDSIQDFKKRLILTTSNGLQMNRNPISPVELWTDDTVSFRPFRRKIFHYHQQKKSTALSHRYQYLNCHFYAPKLKISHFYWQYLSEPVVWFTYICNRLNIDPSLFHFSLFQHEGLTSGFLLLMLANLSASLISHGGYIATEMSSYRFWVCLHTVLDQPLLIWQAIIIFLPKPACN